MINAVLYNVFLCWMVSVAGWMVARTLFRQPQRNLAWQSLAGCWNFAAMLWFFAGLRNFFYFLYLLTKQVFLLGLDRLMFFADEICLACQLLAGIIFVTEVIWQNRRRTWVLAGFSFVSLAAFLLLLFTEGIVETVTTTWGTEHELPRNAFFAFLPGYVLSLLLFGYGILLMIWRRWHQPDKFDRAALVAIIAMSMYALAGIVDVRGTWSGWHLLLIRLVYPISALLTLLVALPQETSIRIVAHGRKA